MLILLLANQWLSAENVIAGELADKQEPAREERKFYRNQAERREAELGYEATDWLRISTVFEAEAVLHKREQMDGKIQSSSISNLDVELGFYLNPKDNLEAELIFVTDQKNVRDVELEEVIFSIDIESWTLEFGKQTLPFSEFYSHFLTGAVLENIEIIQWSLLLEYEFTDSFNVTTFVYQDSNDTDHELAGKDWGIALEWLSEDETMQFTTSYVSDLGEAQDADILFTSNSAKSISGSALSLLIGFDNSELSFEHIQANEKLTNLRSIKMTNLEYAWFLSQNTQLALRLEHNDIISDLVNWRCGVAGKWRIAEYYALSSELFYARLNGNTNDIRSINKEVQIGFGLSIEY